MILEKLRKPHGKLSTVTENLPMRISHSALRVYSFPPLAVVAMRPSFGTDNVEGH